jgi:hypothetical protein
MKKILLKIKTFILLCLPLGLYLWILKHTNTRMQEYHSDMGNNPVAFLVYHDTLLVDMGRLSI